MTISPIWDENENQGVPHLENIEVCEDFVIHSYKCNIRQVGKPWIFALNNYSLEQSMHQATWDNNKPDVDNVIESWCFVSCKK